MLRFIVDKIIGSYNERQIRSAMKIVGRINELEPYMTALTDQEMRAKTDEFRKRIDEYISSKANGEISDDERYKLEQEILNIILPEAFALVREAGRRRLNMRHFDVQLVGGIVLHQGKIAEMATGEGKTLVATLPAYLNALTGRGVHIVTVNDYLARRDREWMGAIYEFLGLSVGVLQHDMPPWERQAVYRCDIVYGTNNEYGFDYLRDNMVIRAKDMVQRELHYAIVDEVDSILIDEARTPLIISGPAEESTELYYRVNKIIPHLERGERNEETKEETGDYIVDEKGHTAYLTEKGEETAARLLGVENLHDVETMEYKHHVNQALRAHTIFKRDKDYVVKDGQVIIVDEFTGRLMPGRRWSDGLHQAVEAKEGVKIERENQTLATITLQNYFRLYKKLAGMTGTAATESAEFREIYSLDVVSIPTNKPLRRINFPDVILKNQEEKYKAVVEEIIEMHEKGRPVLVGTTSIEKSEYLSHLLKLRGIQHQVLNAKYHEREAQIVAQAGRYKAVTIATNMAGRGTDILLGGNPEYMVNAYRQSIRRQEGKEDADIDSALKEKIYAEAKKEYELVVEAGGLHVIGTEKHESRRIDNQLRGRAGRQGDPGSSRFYVALDDDLFRLFAPENYRRFMGRLMETDSRIEMPMITRALEMAQKRVEMHNFEIRKNLLELDEVMNKQREVIYGWRKNVLLSDLAGLKSMLYDHAYDLIENAIDTYMPKGQAKIDWNIDDLCLWLKKTFGIDVNEEELTAIPRIDLASALFGKVQERFEEKIADIPDQENFADFLRMLFLHVIDKLWKEHLHSMDLLKEGIGLRSHGNMDPILEYKREAWDMFVILHDSIRNELVGTVFNVEINVQKRAKSVFKGVPTEERKEEKTALGESKGAPKAAIAHRDKGVGRNDPCPCGSGKKYKKCCGR